jgi:hypothetical protein
MARGQIRNISKEYPSGKRPTQTVYGGVCGASRVKYPYVTAADSKRTQLGQSNRIGAAIGSDTPKPCDNHRVPAVAELLDALATTPDLHGAACTEHRDLFDACTQ